MWFSYSYPVVPDAFDHPPLLPLLAGLEATLLGAEDMFDCLLPRIRPLMLVVGTLSVGLLFLVAREVTSFRTAFVAAVLMAVSPLVVFNSRLVKEDGMIQLFLLLAVYSHIAGKSSWCTGLFAGLAALSKVMGIAVGFALSAVAFAESPRRHQRPLQIFGLTLLFAALYPLFALAIDADTYRRMTTYLALAYSYESFSDKFLILPKMILEPRISAATPLIDGWILLGWLSVLHLFRNRALAVTFVCYLLALMMSVNSNRIWGFYLEPILPFVCLSAAITVRRALLRPDVLNLFLVIALGFLVPYAAIEGAPRPGGFRGVAILAFLPLVPSVLPLPQRHLLRRAGRVLVAAMVVIGITASLHRCVTTF
jgi:4-amino-4-deoxy-L-arabinose transferase-like glycosyltransferase